MLVVSLAWFEGVFTVTSLWVAAVHTFRMQEVVFKATLAFLKDQVQAIKSGHFSTNISSSVSTRTSTGGGSKWSGEDG
jgi:hypothetical protein